jgi:hypothetical protein
MSVLGCGQQGECTTGRQHAWGYTRFHFGIWICVRVIGLLAGRLIEDSGLVWPNETVSEGSDCCRLASMVPTYLRLRMAESSMGSSNRPYWAVRVAHSSAGSCPACSCAGRKKNSCHHWTLLAGGSLLPASQMVRLTSPRSDWTSVAWETHWVVAMVSHWYAYSNTSFASSSVTPCTAKNYARLLIVKFSIDLL